MAVAAHEGQHRKDGAPYLAHPLAVCDLLAAHGESERVLVAALLHDAVEDSDLRVADVAERFGPVVAELVEAVTEDEAIEDWVPRKDELRDQVAAAGGSAVLIYAADKLTNLQEMRTIYAALGESAIDLHKAPTLDLRIEAWERDLAMVAERTPRLPLVEPLRRELTAFAAERAIGRAACPC